MGGGRAPGAPPLDPPMQNNQTLAVFFESRVKIKIIIQGFANLEYFPCEK